MKAWLRTFARALRDEGRLLLRERSILLVLFAVPLVYPIVVGGLYHGEDAHERPALLVDLDGSALSRRLALRIEATPDVRVVGHPATLDAARAAIGRDEAELAIVIPADFSSRVKRGEQAQLAVWAGGANLYTWAIAYPAVVAAAGTTNAELAARAFLARGLPPAAARARAAPVAWGDRLLFHPTGSYGRYLAPGVLLVVLQQVVVLSLAFAGAVRREQGLPPCDPARPFAEGLGHAAAHLPFWCAAAAFVVLGVLPRLGWAGPGTAATIALVAAFLTTMIPIAIGLASVARDRVFTFELLMFFSAPLFVCSGFTWPADQMPAHVRAIAAVFPATPALRALRVLSMKTDDLRVIAPELWWLLGQFVVYGLAALLVVRSPWARRAGPFRSESVAP